MRYEFIDPFIRTTVRILEETVTGTQPRGEAVMVRGDQVTGDVTIIISITGDSQGDVMLCMDTSVALALCSTLLGAPMAALTADALDSLGELGNMIAGNAVSSLNDLGFDLAVTPPLVRVAAGGRAEDSGREALQLCLAGPCGPLTINLHMDNN